MTRDRMLLVAVHGAGPADADAGDGAIELLLAELLGESIQAELVSVDHAPARVVWGFHDPDDDPDVTTDVIECSACGSQELEAVELVRHRWPVNGIERVGGAPFLHAGDGGYTPDDDGLFEHLQCVGCGATAPIPDGFTTSYGTQPADA